MTGLDWQDRQHLELFTRLNQLLDALDQDCTNASISDLFTFLESYVTQHFQEEEQYMREHHFKGYAGHKLAHEGFALRFAQFRRAFAAHGNNRHQAAKLKDWLIAWLMTHIGGVDKEMVRVPAKLEAV